MRVEWDLSSIAPHAESIRLAAEEAGDPIPQDCTPPRLDPSAYFSYIAFRELSIGRSRPLPWTMLDAYAKRHGINDSDAFARFCKVMRAVDEIWMKTVQPEMFPDGH